MQIAPRYKALPSTPLRYARDDRELAALGMTGNALRSG